MSRFFLLVAAIVFSSLTGCSTTRFIVIDATTRQPLENVLVTGYRYQPREYQPSDYVWSDIEVAPTGESGTTSSTNIPSIVPANNEFRYVFSKPGYQTAEALVYSDRALVASPADQAGWKVEMDKKYPPETVPTQNFETVPTGEKILIQLFPTTAPATTTASSQ